MIVPLATFLLQAAARSPQVEVVTAAANVIISGTAVTRVSADASPGALRPVVAGGAGITTVRDSDQSARRIEGTYRITVPRSARVTVRIRCVVEPESPCPNARVRIDSVASVTYESFDGTAIFSGIAGDVEAESLHGTIEVKGAGGRVTASSQTNAIRVSHVRGRSSIRSVTGMIFLESLTGGAEVTNTTGEIRLAGTVGPASKYDMTTDIGQIRIALADGTHATIDVNAPSGAVRVFTRGARVTASGDRRRTIVIGNGSARIAAKTLSGGIDVGRR